MSLFVSGGLLLSFAGGRYAVGHVAGRPGARSTGTRGAGETVVARARVGRAASAACVNASIAGAPVARLVIPKIDLDEIVLEGVDGDELNAGPGHFPGSALPGERGNAIISAHRDRHFSHFDALERRRHRRTESASRRDEVGRSCRQRVVDKDRPALFATPDTTLTLTTCWPIRYLGSAPERLIVTAKPLRS